MCSRLLKTRKMFAKSTNDYLFVHFFLSNAKVVQNLIYSEMEYRIIIVYFGKGLKASIWYHVFVAQIEIELSIECIHYSEHSITCSICFSSIIIWYSPRFFFQLGSYGLLFNMDNRGVILAETDPLFAKILGFRVFHA